MGTVKCLRCGEPLIFSRTKGWVHQDGKIYKTRLSYPGLCRRCMRSLVDGYCWYCKIQYPQQEVDEHCAVPDRG